MNSHDASFAARLRAKQMSKGVNAARVFLGWAGDRGHAVARRLYEWLPTQFGGAVDVKLSSLSLEKGALWTTELAELLEWAEIGILIVEAGSVDSQWLAFEAGVLSHTGGAGKPYPLLLDVGPEELAGPLAQFQCVEFNKQDVLALLLAINDRAGRSLQRDPASIAGALDRSWLELQSAVATILSAKSDRQAGPSAVIRFAELGLHGSGSTGASRHSSWWAELLVEVNPDDLARVSFPRTNLAVSLSVGESKYLHEAVTTLDGAEAELPANILECLVQTRADRQPIVVNHIMNLRLVAAFRIAGLEPGDGPTSLAVTLTPAESSIEPLTAEVPLDALGDRWRFNESV